MSEGSPGGRCNSRLPRLAFSQFFPDELKHFGGVVLDGNLRVDLANHAVFIDYKSDAGRIIAAPAADRVYQFLLGIDRKREVQPLFHCKFRLILKLIGADADDNRIELFEVGQLLPEAEGFDCSARRRGLREEVENDVLLALEVFQPNRGFYGFSVLQNHCLQREVGCGIPLLHLELNAPPASSAVPMLFPRLPTGSKAQLPSPATSFYGLILAWCYSAGV